jgi:hypothetical protein
LSFALKRVKQKRAIKRANPIKVTAPSDREVVEKVEVREVNVKPYVKETIKRPDVQEFKSIDAETLKYWEGIFKGAETLKEGELIDRMLENYHLEETPTNNTICINEVFEAGYEGYLKQNGYHIWEINRNK